MTAFLQSLNVKRQQVTRPSQLWQTLTQQEPWRKIFFSAQLISNQSRNCGMNQQKIQRNDCEWVIMDIGKKLISRPSALQTRIALLKFWSFPLGLALNRQNSNFDWVPGLRSGAVCPSQVTRISIERVRQAKLARARAWPAIAVSFSAPAAAPGNSQGLPTRFSWWERETG